MKTQIVPLAALAAGFAFAEAQVPVVKPPFAESGASLYRPKTQMFADKIVSGTKALEWTSGIRGNSSALRR